MSGGSIPPVHAGDPSERPRVMFVNPGRSDEVFWDMVSNFMAAAARDLNIDLEVVTAERDHLKMVELALQAAASDNPPDYMILVNEKLAAGKMLDELPASIKLMLLNNNLSAQQADKFGVPRQKKENWIASIYPNHEKAGYDIGTTIIAAAGQAGYPAIAENLGLLAIGGNRATPASVQRMAGLHRAMAARTDIHLYQTIHSQWRRDKAQSQMSGLLRRWPETRLIWAANDPMALGAMDAAIKRGRKPGQDVFIGGLNWSGEALERVRDGSMTASVGGHFMQGGWLMVLIHDFHAGRDFADIGVEFTAPMSVIDTKNVEPYLAAFGDQDWDRIDFLRFSRGTKETNFHYELGLDEILSQFKAEK
jgi:ABC-type sugar transport system substrate-binding protein